MTRPFSNSFRRALVTAPLIATVDLLTACFDGDDEDRAPDVVVVPTPTPTPTPTPSPVGFDVGSCLNRVIPGTGGVTVAGTVVPDTLTLVLGSNAGFPNGRLLSDPVIDVTLAVIFLDLSRNGPGTLAGLPLNPPSNDVPFSSGFPFLAPAQGTQVMTSPGSGFAFRAESASAYTRVDRMGMPAISTVLIGSGLKNSYNDANPVIDAAGEFVPELAAQLTGLTNVLADDLVGAGLNLHRVTGAFDNAIATLASASRAEKHTPVVLSGIALQTGMIASARGDYVAANNWNDRAETLFPGHWLTALYRAEGRLANGQTQSAITELERVARDHARPEAMDMLALVWRVRGDIARSRIWAQRAGAIWQEWADRYPAAFAAHASEHALVFGDATEALRLARINVAARPFGETRLLLERALMANDQPDAALIKIGRAEKSGWRSAQLFAIKAQALTILGESEAAAAASDTARAMNRKIDNPATRLIWLAHG